jgi:2-dehydro-3-deoxyphosphooctonate aldolase (KDO 8-P synthase)
MLAIFKGSFDKANRAAGNAPRGIGLEEGLRALERVRAESGLRISTDVHETHQVSAVAQVVDVLQIPAFLCRQTDLLVAAGASGRAVNVKKGQWMTPEAMAGAADKVRNAGCAEMAVTERGTFFGYGDLIVDMRAFQRVRAAAGVPVLFDATHSVQRSGAGSLGQSGGDRECIPALLSAAAGAGADGFFLETHPEPERSVSDAASMWPLDRLDALIERAVGVWEVVHGAATAHA